MDLIVKNLRKGAKKIISRHSPFGRKAEKGEFKIDSHPEREILFVLQGKSEFMLADSCCSAALNGNDRRESRHNSLT